MPLSRLVGLSVARLGATSEPTLSPLEKASGEGMATGRCHAGWRWEREMSNEREHMGRGGAFAGC